MRDTTGRIGRQPWIMAAAMLMVGIAGTATRGVHTQEVEAPRPTAAAKTAPAKTASPKIAPAATTAPDAKTTQATKETQPAKTAPAAKEAQAGKETQAARPLQVLFLGHDRTHHPSGALLPLLAAPLARRGIQITHVNTPEEALVPATLARYDALMIYANHKTITPEQEQALLQFVEGGKGLVAIHCASAMFTDSARYIALVGGEFQRHGTGEFSTEIVKPDHPVMQGLKPFTTWDETYVHTRHNPTDRTVLMERVDAEGREPYTWVRTQGKGRIFYTAYGHDQRTWSKPEFQQLIAQGLLWTVDDATRRSWQQLKMPEVVYVDGFNVPNYENRDPAPKYQMPFSPRQSMQFIQTPAEFRLELFASEPDIIKPITFSFDARGRLWVIEAIDYPNRVLAGQPGEDRIKILEDTNGDGRADKFTVFADRLNLASSLVFANDGVIVSAAPHFLFLKDTNGDDKADVREILHSGWGLRDSHAGPSNLQYAPDNHIWGVVGYSGYDGEMNGKKMQFLQGAYRFKPDGTGFELLTGSTNNTWGLGFSETFDVFGSTANNEPSFYMAIPNRYFEGVVGLTDPSARPNSGPGYQNITQFYAAHYVTPYIRQVDVHGGYTAAAGHHLYTARAFPKSYWNRIAFITEPTVHVVGQGILEKQGAGFMTRDGWNLLAGAEEWVAPVHAQVGPDGAVWVADWYNFIAQHNPTPVGFSNGPGNAYETSMRDRHRGRIYRVVYKDAPASSSARPRALTKSDPAGLLAALASDNMLWRLHAQRLLVERAQQDVVPRLIALTRDTSVDAIGTNGAALHALWTLHGLGALASTTSEAGRAAVAALKHPAAGVRKAAAMVLPRAPAATATETASALLNAGALADADLHTRLAVLLTLADLPADPSGAIAKALYAASLDATNTGDRWLSRALYIAAHRHKAEYLTQYRGDPNAVPLTALPLSLRLGNSRPDWRTPDAAALAADWKEMQVPGNWEARGLPGFDGVVWFTRTVDIPAAAVSSSSASSTPSASSSAASSSATSSSSSAGAPAGGATSARPASLTGSVRFGRISNQADVWVNGVAIAAPQGAPVRGAPPPAWVLPADALRPGTNTITVRIQNTRGDGGFLGQPDAMAIEVNQTRTPLAGTWKYRTERQTNAPTLYAKPGELAAHLAFATRTDAAERGVAALKPAAAPTPDVVVRLGVLAGQMKFDKSELTVAPGQLVQLVFTNNDAMQHNFILGASGSLPQIGAAADALGGPDGPALQYVPQIAQVLFATTLVDPGQSVTVQFRAPSQAGQYPYVCTFPGHWRLMNGTLTVAAASSARAAVGR